MKYSVLTPKYLYLYNYTSGTIEYKYFVLNDICGYTEDNNNPDFYIDLGGPYKEEVKIKENIDIYSINKIIKNFIYDKNKKHLFESSSEIRDMFEKSILSKDKQAKYLSLILLLKNITQRDLFKIGKLIQYGIYPYNELKKDGKILITSKTLNEIRVFQSLAIYAKNLNK